MLKLSVFLPEFSACGGHGSYHCSGDASVAIGKFFPKTKNF